MVDAGLEGNYSNHSLRETNAAKLFYKMLISSLLVSKKAIFVTLCIGINK